MLRGVLAATVIFAGLLGGCQSLESANQVSPAPSATLLPIPVPGSLQHSVQLFAGTLSPLTAEQLPLVQVAADTAASAVLTHERDTGWPDLDIAWRDGGCVMLAWYERHPMSRAPNPDPPSAVYVVRLVDELDASRETWVMVEASTGQIGAVFGGPWSSDCAAVAS